MTAAAEIIVRGNWQTTPSTAGCSTVEPTVGLADIDAYSLSFVQVKMCALRTRPLAHAHPQTFVTHHGLTKAQAESLEAIQRRALTIIDSSTVGVSYQVALSLTQFVSLHDRREHLKSPTSSLHSETPALPPDYVLRPYTTTCNPH